VFRRRPRRRIIVSTLADVDVDAVVRELADGIDGLYVLSTEPRRFLWRQRVEVNVDGPDEAVRSSTGGSTTGRATTAR
jgi:hypothetical protein